MLTSGQNWWPSIMLISYEYNWSHELRSQLAFITYGCDVGHTIWSQAMNMIHNHTWWLCTVRVSAPVPNVENRLNIVEQSWKLTNKPDMGSGGDDVMTTRHGSMLWSWPVPDNYGSTPWSYILGLTWGAEPHGSAEFGLVFVCLFVVYMFLHVWCLKTVSTLRPRSFMYSELNHK